MLITKKTNEFGSRSYDIEVEQRVLRELCWDEMLGMVARVCLTGSDLPLPMVEWLAYEGSPSRLEYTLRITRVDGAHWTIENDGRFCDRLTFDEMLGFVAKFTLTGEVLFGGFRSYEEWARVTWRRRLPPKAMLCQC